MPPGEAIFPVPENKEVFMKKSMFKRIFVPVIIFLLCLLLLGGSMMGIMPGSQSQNQISSSPDSQAEPETGSIDAE